MQSSALFHRRETTGVRRGAIRCGTRLRFFQDADGLQQISSKCARLRGEAALGIGINHKATIAEKSDDGQAHFTRQLDGETGRS